MNRKPAKGRARAKKSQHCDTLTVLIVTGANTATKRFVKSGDEIRKIDFSAGFLFVARAYPIAGIKELSAVLMTLEQIPGAFVIRGAPVEVCDLTRPLRRTKKNFQTPAPGRRYLLVDVDKLKLPKGLSLKRSLTDVLKHLVELLPQEFHDVSYHWQLSSSAGMGNPNVVSLHLWFWLKSPVPDADLRRWGKAVNSKLGVKLVDTQLFCDVQPHYTAAPIFEGIKNPFPVRSGFVRKVRDDVVLKLPRHSKPDRTAPVGAPGSSESDVTGFDAILAQVGDHEGGEGFHNPIIRAVASYVRTHGRDGTDIEKLYDIVQRRVLAADSSRHDESYIERMASRDHIIPAIEGALEKYGTTSRAVRKSRQIEGLKPHYATEPASATEALAILQGKIDTFFR